MRTRTQFSSGPRTQCLCEPPPPQAGSGSQKELDQSLLCFALEFACAEAALPFLHIISQTRTQMQANINTHTLTQMLAHARKCLHMHANACTRTQTLAHERNMYTHEIFGCFARTKTHTDVNCVLSVGDFHVRMLLDAKRWFKDFQN